MAQKIIPRCFAQVPIGINGAGRIGKFLAWHFIAKQFFAEIVMNIGRGVGKDLNDFINYFSKDSSFTSLERYLHGHKGNGCSIQHVDEKEGTFYVHGVKIRVLRETRRPEMIGWGNYGVSLVVDTTGGFLDPSEPVDGKKGSLLGHLEAGAKKIIVSAPFKVKKDKNAAILEKTTTIIAGINDVQYDPKKHFILSTASCTTTCLAHLMLPLVKAYKENIDNVRMSTIHASTSTQAVLDRAPKAGADDLRKLRSIFNNIIFTTTGATKALPLVIEGLEKISFSATSIRVPINTGSIVELTLSLLIPTDVQSVNGILKEAAEKDRNGYLVYDESQNVSSDIIGSTAACTFESTLTEAQNSKRTPNSLVTVFGWYDNETGYMAMMAENILKIAEEFVV